MKAKVGDRFSVSIADGIVEMEVTGLRCGDVWDCHPVDPNDLYGEHLVFTDDQVARKVRSHGQGARRPTVWTPG